LSFPNGFLTFFGFRTNLPEIVFIERVSQLGTTRPIVVGNEYPNGHAGNRTSGGGHHTTIWRASLEYSGFLTAARVSCKRIFLLVGAAGPKGEFFGDKVDLIATKQTRQSLPDDYRCAVQGATVLSYRRV
jgi:hypothetical protein